MKKPPAGLWFVLPPLTCIGLAAYYWQRTTTKEQACERMSNGNCNADEVMLMAFFWTAMALVAVTVSALAYVGMRRFEQRRKSQDLLAAGPGQPSDDRQQD